MRARLRFSDLVRMALAWAISSLALIVGVRILSGLQVLVSMLVQLGHRSHLPRPVGMVDQ